MQIRRYRKTDWENVYRLFRQQTRELPCHHNVRRDQFRDDLFTSRFIRAPKNHDSRARIGIVATKNDRITAFVSGGVVTKGDEVVRTGTGYIQAIIASRAATGEVKELISRVVEHIKRHAPKKIVAFDGCMCPAFFADSAGTLPSNWAWIGQCLLDQGFEINERFHRLVARLDKPRRKPKTPKDLLLHHGKHEMDAFDPKYDFGCILLKPPFDYGDGVVWCGNFYSGAFVKGSGFRSLYMNYFTILDDDYRGKGLGRMVLQHCLHEAQQKGSRYASLLTSDDNFIAQNLYQSEGFEIIDATHSFVL